jgi:hypothetical protein
MCGAIDSAKYTYFYLNFLWASKQP